MDITSNWPTWTPFVGGKEHSPYAVVVLKDVGEMALVALIASRKGGGGLCRLHQRWGRHITRMRGVICKRATRTREIFLIMWDFYNLAL